MNTFNQNAFDIRCEWGKHGIDEVATGADALIIVDVMSFTTCVSLVVSRGAFVYPYPTCDASAEAFAASRDAVLVSKRSLSNYSLSPASLLDIPAGTQLVLPSLNGATLSMCNDMCPTFAGCLRNARAVANAAMQCGPRIAVIPAGERWHADGSLRPAIEDLIGAGAIIQHLIGTLSPEAQLAHDAYVQTAPHLLETLYACASGQELIAMGFAQDIVLIGDLDADDTAPMLSQGVYQCLQCKRENS